MLSAMSRRTRILFPLALVLIVGVALFAVSALRGGPSLADAAEKVSGENVQLKFSMTMSAEGQTVKMNGDASARGDGKGSKATFQMTGDALPQPIEFTVLQVGKDVYMQGDKELTGELPEGKSWVRIDPKLVPQTSVSTSNYAAFLREAGDVKKSGTTKINGTSVTLYTGTLTAQEIADAMGGDTGEQLKKQLDGQNIKMPVRAWLDDQGRPLRVSLTFDVQGVKMDMSSDFSNFGAPVDDVVAPPAGEVAESDQVNELMGG